MTRLLAVIFDGSPSTILNVAVLVIAAVSLLAIGYFLLVKSNDSNFSSRER
jgi:hypothetical protein